MSSQAAYSELVRYTRLPSRLTSTICGPPPRGRPGAAGCGWRRTMPPRRTEPASRGLDGSLTSYCLSSPVPQQETYSQRSSTDRSMSETSGGTAPKGCSAGGRSSGSAGWAGMVTTLRTAQRSPSWCHSHTDPDRSSTLMTTPTKPQALEGSWAGRTSNTSWCWSPRSTRWVPPDVVPEELVAAVQLPGADDVEGVVVQQRDPAGAVVASCPAERGHEDAAWPAMDGVGPGIAGLAGQLLGLDGADHLRVARVGLGVQHVGPRGADAGDDQVAPLQRGPVVAVALVAQCAGAGVPAEVVQLVAGGRQLAPADHPAELRRGHVTVDHRNGILHLARRVERGHICQPLRRRGNRVSRGAVKRGIQHLGHMLAPVIREPCRSLSTRETAYAPDGCGIRPNCASSETWS